MDGVKYRLGLIGVGLLVVPVGWADEALAGLPHPLR